MADKHEHDWEFVVKTVDSDGKEWELYKCSVEGCNATEEIPA
jgi:hypothetical protein